MAKKKFKLTTSTAAIIAIVVIVFIIFFATSGQTGLFKAVGPSAKVGTTPTGFCFDSDRANPGQKGYCTDASGTYNDGCGASLGGTTAPVKEYSCDFANIKCVSNNVACPQNTGCLDGRCVAFVCGDGVCLTGEQYFCQKDCCPSPTYASRGTTVYGTCGNGICETAPSTLAGCPKLVSEDGNSCYADCGACGNGVCEVSERIVDSQKTTCPEDCTS